MKNNGRSFRHACRLNLERRSAQSVHSVIAGLDPAIHPLRKNFFAKKKMDARVISAFTRVFDALLPAHDAWRA